MLPRVYMPLTVAARLIICVADMVMPPRHADETLLSPRRHYLLLCFIRYIYIEAIRYYMLRRERLSADVAVVDDMMLLQRLKAMSHVEFVYKRKC